MEKIKHMDGYGPSAEDTEKLNRLSLGSWIMAIMDQACWDIIYRINQMGK